eukprot:scaffold317457_cov21-Tisochrysis_lutea.AAC.2
MAFRGRSPLCGNSRGYTSRTYGCPQAKVCQYKGHCSQETLILWSGDTHTFVRVGQAKIRRKLFETLILLDATMQN